MGNSQPNHHEDSGTFRQAIAVTAARTGFREELIEKDYFCSLLLRDLAPLFQAGLVFKGGTCLSKVYADFYRLSEDLDFVVPVPVDARRSARSELAAPLKRHLDDLHSRLECLVTEDPLQGHNRSKQYIARCSYASVVTGERESVKLEIGLREPLLEPTESRLARTILLDPLRRTEAVLPIEVRVLSLREAYAEKFRAALTRLEPAIRDFYDIHFAVQRGLLQLTDRHLLRLIRDKLAVPGNPVSDLSGEKHAALVRQMSTRLRPVLRPSDFVAFDVERAFNMVLDVFRRLGDGQTGRVG